MCRWSKPWILSSSQWLLIVRPWKTSWWRRREESSIWRYEPLTLRDKCASISTVNPTNAWWWCSFYTAWLWEEQGQAWPGGETHHQCLVQHGERACKYTKAQTGTTSTPPNPSLLHLSLSSALFTCQGMGLHQKVSGERLGSSNQAMSFLAQQRQLTNARRGLTRHHPRWDTEAWQLPSNEKQSAHKVIHVISECLLPFLCLHWDHCASVLSRCCCPLLALTDMRRFLFSVGLQSRSSLLWLKSRSYRP